MNQALKVSILIPCYNAQAWIEHAIQTALDQSFYDKEVIVIDDGSTDNSLEIIKGFGDNIRWEATPNRGGNAARNRLLELSTGEWLQFLDADDYLLPDKVANQIKCLARHPQTDIIYSPSIFEFCGTNSSRKEIFPIPEPHDPWILLARWYLPQTGSPLWRRRAIEEVGGWKPDQPCCQEHELYLRLLKAGKQFEYCSDAGSIYCQWSESTVCKRNKSETFRQRLAIEDAIEQHLNDINQLTPERLYAINQARFECARLIWVSNKRWAKDIITQINSSDCHFVPTGSAAPQTYRFTYKFFGFRMAEQMAELKRSLNRSDKELTTK